ncbi:hypothetical protein [Saliniramus sp.]|uniref:hypothetical protein n=1 Tax=Saliniramus sp. TaxID=2986772 RepID=UPI002C101E72|nr:hypothetical protein [Saliniramus sp.]HMB11526.1 hypothetical protein [Saliniramus sp.]
MIAAAALGFGGISRFEIQAGSFAPILHGFFFNTFAPLMILVIYAVARIVAVALLEPSDLALARFVTAPLAVAALLVAALYPTFGGIIARSAFFSGGMMFIEGMMLGAAWLIGIAFAAIIFGFVLGAGVIFVRLGFAEPGRPPRTRLATGLMRYVALVFAGLILLLPGQTGISLYGDWPVWPMQPREAAALTAFSLIALAPHAMIVRCHG